MFRSERWNSFPAVVSWFLLLCSRVFVEGWGKYFLSFCCQRFSYLSKATSWFVHYVAHLWLCFLTERFTTEYVKFRILRVSDSYIDLIEYFACFMLPFSHPVFWIRWVGGASHMFEETGNCYSTQENKKSPRCSIPPPHWITSFVRAK